MPREQPTLTRRVDIDMSCVRHSQRRGRCRSVHAINRESLPTAKHVDAVGAPNSVPTYWSSTATDRYPWAPPLDGGFTLLELPSREEAITWDARIAKACRCDQELRVFGFDPQS